MPPTDKDLLSQACLAQTPGEFAAACCLALNNEDLWEDPWRGPKALEAVFSAASAQGVDFAHFSPTVWACAFQSHFARDTLYACASKASALAALGLPYPPRSEFLDRRALHYFCQAANPSWGSHCLSLSCDIFHSLEKSGFCPRNPEIYQAFADKAQQMLNLARGEEEQLACRPFLDFALRLRCAAEKESIAPVCQKPAASAKRKAGP